MLLIEGHWNHPEPWDEYEAIHEALPLYHARPPDELRRLLAEVGLRDVKHEPLTDPTLWGREPRHDYYVVRATVPE